MARWVEAKLKTLFYKSGRQAMKDGTPLGKIYIVDADSRKVMLNMCTEDRSKDFMVECIQVDDGAWLPTEVMEISDTEAERKWQTQQHSGH